MMETPTLKIVEKSLFQIVIMPATVTLQDWISTVGEVLFHPGHTVFNFFPSKSIDPISLSIFPTLESLYATEGKKCSCLYLPEQYLTGIKKSLNPNLKSLDLSDDLNSSLSFFLGGTLPVEDNFMRIFFREIIFETLTSGYLPTSREKVCMNMALQPIGPHVEWLIFNSQIFGVSLLGDQKITDYLATLKKSLKQITTRFLSTILQNTDRLTRSPPVDDNQAKTYVSFYIPLKNVLGELYFEIKLPAGKEDQILKSLYNEKLVVKKVPST